MSPMPDAASVLRRTRQRAGLTQVQLADRAGVTQSVISAYEAGRRQPSLRALARLVEAAGFRLDVEVHRRSAPTRLQGPLGRTLVRQRRRLTEAAARHGASNLRVFGSVARGDESADSDVDLLVDLAPGVGLLGLARLQRDLENILHARVDVVPADDLKPGVRANVGSDVVPL